MRKSTKQLASCLLTLALAVSSVTAPVNTDTAKAATVTNSPARVSVHDPSIVEAKDGYYYVYGSHTSAAKSKDLVNWTSFGTDILAASGPNSSQAKNNSIFGNIAESLKKPLAWAGDVSDTDDHTYHIWAPDVFWNEEYVNADGTTGAYMMYFCTTSTWNRSVVAFATSKDISGPFTAVDTLIYSGFAKGGTYDYQKTNIDELIADGTLKDGMNSNWFDNSSYNFRYAPNAIDPTAFYDKDGKLWLTYGSWSGGIFVLPVDAKTGYVIHPGKNSVTEDGLVVDEYFGTRISGGYHHSGEAPYILYDKESDYYYLYVTNNALNADGGYNMRLFRSKNPDGPYYDAAGNKVLHESTTESNSLGIKVMGNYTFSSLTRGYKAPGHNSAFIDTDGQRYLFYHTRFDNWGEIHQVRVHQQFLNEAGWPVTAVFENKGDKISEAGYDSASITGDYEFINHGTNADMANVRKPQNITLNADGTISGDIKGTWEAKNGTYYMSAVIDNVTYSGVFFLQHNESGKSDATEKVMTFTAIGTNNTTIWGVRKAAYTYTDKEALEIAGSNLDAELNIYEKTTGELTLPTAGANSVTVSWSSSNTNIIANDGKVTRPEADTEVTLTATLTRGNDSITKTYTTTVLAKNPTPDFCYDFENVSGNKVSGSGADTAEATLNGTAAVTNDSFAGNVLTVKSTSGTKGKNYLALPSNLFKNVGNSGFTISMWEKHSSSTADDSLLLEAKSSKGIGNLPAIGLFVGGYGSVLSNQGNINGVIGITPDVNSWNLVTFTVTPSGITTYVNGTPLTSQNGNLTDVLVTDFLASIDDIRIGGTTLLGSEDTVNTSIDNIEFYSAALSADEVAAKYQAEKASYPNLSLQASKSTIYFGGDKDNTSKLSIENDATFTFDAAYSSSNSSVASVNSTGTVTAKKAGTATITATLTDSNGKTQKITKKITVKKAYLKISKKKSSLKVKKSFTFKAKGYGLKAASLTWSSSKPSVLSINKKTGKATAKKAGTAKVTAKYKSFKVSVSVKVKK